MKLPEQSRQRYGNGWKWLGLPLLSLTLATAAWAQDYSAREELHLGEQRFGEGSIPTAMAHYQKAEKLGNVLAMARLGDVFRFAEDYAEAKRYYQQALDRGHMAGAVGLGQLYAGGLGVARDPAKALAYYQQAADAGWFEAHRVMVLLYEKGDVALNVAADPAKAKFHREEEKRLRASYVREVEEAAKAIEAKKKAAGGRP